MADIVQDVGVYNVKDELVFVDEIFCVDFTEEVVIDSVENGCESNDSGSSSFDCSESLTISEYYTEPSIDSYEEISESNIKDEEHKDIKFHSDARFTSENVYEYIEKVSESNLKEGHKDVKLNQDARVTSENVYEYAEYSIKEVAESNIKEEGNKDIKFTSDARLTSENVYEYAEPSIEEESEPNLKEEEHTNNPDSRLTSEIVQSTSSEEFEYLKSQSQKENVDSHLEDSQSDLIEERTENSGKRIWACKECDKTFISRKGSVIHLRTHTGERPFTCNICHKCFIDSSTLMKHQVIHQDTRPFTCTICHRGFNQKVALQRHESTHSLQPLFTCKYCPKTFLVRSSLQAHENIHSRVKPYLCGFCPSRFHTLTLQRQHERVHTNERPYQCNFCPKAFKDSGTLFKHQVIHSGVKPYCCPLCSNGFTQKVAVRKHIRTHVLKLLSNYCPICKITVPSQEELCFHLEKHVLENSNLANKLPSKSEHDFKDKKTHIEEKPIESDLSDLATLCDVAISTSGNYFSDNNPLLAVRGHFCCFYCGMRYKRERTLHSHLTGVHLFCLICNTKFYDRKELDTHKCGEKNNYTANVLCRVITKQQFRCEKCSKSFNSRNGFVIHQRSHTGERPYGCRWCDKAFGDSATRHKHERIHTGERPFKCTSCSRAFNQRAALRAHQVTHTCDRAFTCKHCPSSFLYATTLRKHVEACHTDILEVSCPLCAKNCSDSLILHAHITETHSGEAQECGLCESGVFTNSSEYCDHIVWHAKQHVLDIYVKSKNCKQIKGKSKLNSKSFKERKYSIE